MMSSNHAKTNLVRPHPKASYIRPLYDVNENGIKLKESCEIFEKLAAFSRKAPGDVCKAKQLKGINDAKEEHIQNLNSAYSKCYEEIDKFQQWRSTIEVECKQKNKKIDELTETVESQRKVIVNLQKQYETLSLQHNEEIQNRVSLLEKFYFIKEVYSTLRKTFADLQEQFNACKKTKETIIFSSTANVETIELLKNKFSAMCSEYSEKVAFLNEALKNEKHNNLVLKEICQQQNTNANEQNKSYRKIFEKYEEELKNYAADLAMERNKSSNLEKDKNEMIEKISCLENTIEDNLNILKATEEQLKLTLERENEIKKSYECEILKVDNLTRKCEELEELKNKQTSEFEDLKTAFNSLEKSLSETIQKLEEFQCMNEKLSVTLKDVEDKKGCLEVEISHLKAEKEELEKTSVNDRKIFDEVKEQMLKEKDKLHSSINLLEDKLQTTLLEKENNSKLYLESCEKVSTLTNDYENSISKIEKLSLIEEKYNETLVKIGEMKVDIEAKSELLQSNELHMREFQDLKLKYDENKIKIKDLEQLIKSKSEQLELKEEAIQELKVIEQQCAVNYEKVKDLENTNQKLLNDLNAKEKKISDINALLNEKKLEIERLQIDNLRMEDNLRGHLESVKVCLECELMEEKLMELDQLKNTLANMEMELAKQKQMTSDTMKMLGETEDKFDEIRIRKEKELVRCKDTIQSLQHQLRMLKIDVADSLKLKNANEKLQIDIEELKLQNETDLKRLETENQQLKTEITVLKSKKNLFPDMMSKALENSANTTLENSASEAQENRAIKRNLEESSFLPKSQESKIEPDSSVDKTPSLKGTIRPVISSYKKFCKEVNSKETVKQIQSTPLKELKMKRAWDNESSGSECLEIVFDNKEKFVGCTPRMESKEIKRTPINIVTPTPSVPNQKGNLPVRERKIPDNDKNQPMTSISFTSKPNASDAFLSFRSVTKSTPKDSPWRKRAADVETTPTTPGGRKFFKTPINERESSFKKPLSQKMWF